MLLTLLLLVPVISFFLCFLGLLSRRECLIVLHVFLRASLFHRELNVLTNLSRTHVSRDPLIETDTALGCLIFSVLFVTRVKITLLSSVSSYCQLILKLGLILSRLFELGL